MDGLYSIWNVAWVARTAVTHPFSLFDGNIFYPHRNTLAYSEANIVAGAVSIPVWLLTRNAYAAHSFALLFAFASTFLGMWLLARRLTNNPGSAIVAAILFAFCPYFYSHTPHIQLLMAGGIPVSMLALHRLADAPSPRRGLALGAALAVQSLACAYYGIFAGLMVGYGVLFLATQARRLYIQELVKGLPGIERALADGARELCDAPAEHTVAVRRRDVLGEIQKYLRPWSAALAESLQRSSTHPSESRVADASPPGRTLLGDLSLVDDDTIEREITSSRLIRLIDERKK